MGFAPLFPLLPPVSAGPLPAACRRGQGAFLERDGVPGQAGISTLAGMGWQAPS